MGGERGNTEQKMKFKITIEIDGDRKKVFIFDEKSGRAYEMGSVMIMAGGPTEGGNMSTCMLAYGNTNVFADIVEDQVFRTAVEQSWSEHVLFDKIYYGILAGKFLCNLKGVPIELPEHPSGVDAETVLEMLKELEREKDEDEKREKMKKFTLYVNPEVDEKRH